MDANTLIAALNEVTRLSNDQRVEIERLKTEWEEYDKSWRRVAAEAKLQRASLEAKIETLKKQLAEEREYREPMPSCPCPPPLPWPGVWPTTITWTCTTTTSSEGIPKP